MTFPTREETQDALDLLRRIPVVGFERFKAGQLRREIEDVDALVFHVLPPDEVIAAHNEAIETEMEERADAEADAEADASRSE